MPGQTIDPHVFLATGEEVFLTLVCTRCGHAKPLKNFGLRRVDGKVRSISQCKACRQLPPVRVRDLTLVRRTP